jgi:hypothetical protein
MWQTVLTHKQLGKIDITIKTVLTQKQLGKIDITIKTVEIRV